MNLNAKAFVVSTAQPEVSYTVRRLNMIQRSKRDALVAEQRLEYTKLTMEVRALTEQLIGTEGTPEERAATISQLPTDQRAKLMDIQHHMELLLNEHLIPASIRAGLIAVQGLTTDDGKAITVEQFMESAPDDLIEEAFRACEAHASLSEDQQKN
jgi:hypothetical protein